ncbi:hypothetical protein B649_05525 [Candidatus Sulfuricurvum sp. RIFRC-1]|nr:hypothetical protein B649_05525 [Candidatus Sulfuricurvum sp. RIFRC-1]
MSATAKFELDTEFNVATLAAIVSDNSTPNNIDINSIIIDLQNNNSNPDSVSSYENAFNMGRHYYSKLTGTQEGDLFRTGYFADGDWASNTPDAYEAAKKNGWDIALIGNEQVNTLITGSGNDLLDGGFSGDTLEGGTGYDTYIAGDGDTIMDDDGKGIVTFEGDILSGGTLTESHELYDQYEGDGGTYYLLKTTNALIYQKGEQFLTIENYHKDAKSLGITLTDELPELTIIGHMANENDGTVTGKVVLTQAYGRDMIIHLSTLDDSAHTGEDYHSNNNITVTITAGETEGDFSVTLIDNQIVEGRETFFAQIDSVTDTSNQPIQYTIKDITPLTIEDDDGLNVSVFAPTVSENAGIATGAVTINKTQYDREVAA